MDGSMRMRRHPTGPEANPLYKTEMCKKWLQFGYCRYGDRCQFAHGLAELRPKKVHPKYKTERCRTFWTHGWCPYGERCRFLHDESNPPPRMLLPTGGAMVANGPPPEATAPHMPQAMMPPAGLQAPMYPGMGAAPVPSMPRRDWVVPHAEGSDPWDLVKSVSPSSPMSDVSHGSFSKPQAPPQHYYDMNSLLDALEHSVSEGSHHPHPSITGAQAMQQPSSTSGDRRDVFRGMAMSLGALSGNLGGRWTTNLIPVGGSDSPKGSMPQSMGFSDTSSTMNPFSSGTTSMTSSAPLSYRDEIAVLQSKVRRLSSEAPNESFGKGKQPTSSPLEQGLQLELPYQRVSLDEDAHEGSSTPVGHVLKTQGKGFNYPRKYPSDDTDRDSEGVLEGSEISSTSASTASSHFRSGAVSTKSNGTTTSLHR